MVVDFLLLGLVALYGYKYVKFRLVYLTWPFLGFNLQIVVHSRRLTHTHEADEDSMKNVLFMKSAQW